MRRIALAGSLLTAVLTSAAGAQPVVSTFSEYASPVTREYPATVGDPLSSGVLDFYEAFSGGFERNVLATWGTDPVADPLGAINVPTNVGTSTAMFATAPLNEIDILARGANLFGTLPAFHLFSIDIAHQHSSAYFLPAAIPLVGFELEFFGARTSGPVISQKFTIAPPPVVGGIQRPMLQTLTFDNRWRNVVNAWWFQGGSLNTLHQFTNVAAQLVPEPGTYVLMLTGLGLVGLVAVRRRQA